MKKNTHPTFDVNKSLPLYANHAYRVTKPIRLMAILIVFSFTTCRVGKTFHLLPPLGEGLNAVQKHRTEETEARHKR